MIISRTLSSIIGRDTSWACSLSTRFGGLGLRGSEYNKIGYLASSYKLDINDKEEILENMKLALQGQDLPDEITQRNCSRILDKLQFNDFFYSLNTLEDKSRMVSLSSKYALSWINAVPNKRFGLYLDPQQFTISIKLILGMQIYNQSSICHSCTGNNDPFGYHCLSCSPTKGSRIHKHNIIRDLLFRDMQKACLSPQKERNLTGGTRPGDIMLPLFKNNKDLYLDIAVISPFTDLAFKNGAATDKQTHINSYEDLKKKNYDHEFNKSPNACFQPLIVDSLGAWSDSAVELFMSVAKSITNLTLDTYGSVLNNMFQRYSSALYQVNSRILALRLG